MPAVAYLTWSGDSASESSDGSKTTQERAQKWQIIDAPDHASAMSAAGLPVINQELYPGSPFRVRSRNPRKVGPTTWEADIRYGIPENGGYTTPDPDPKNQPKRITWGQSFRQFPMEQDARKRMVRNSAGDVFDPLPTQDRIVETLSVRWTTDYYDRATAKKYLNKVNSDQFTIGSTTIYPRECLCTFYGPAGEYAVDTNTIEMLATFEIQTDARADDGESGFPFDAHLLDQGVNGWYIDTDDSNTLKKGYFCTTKTGTDSVERVLTIITAPILLNGYGKPLVGTAPGVTLAEIKVTSKSDGTGKVFSPAEAPPQFWMRSTPPIGGANYDKSPFTNENLAATYGPHFIWLFRSHAETPFAGIV